MKSISPPTVKLYGRARKLVTGFVIASLLSVTISTVHSQNPSNPTLQGQSRSVLLVPNSTVNAGEVKFKADTDHDGMTDEDEAENSTDPNDPSDADADNDGDGLSNGDEVASGANVNSADSDGDGVSDGEEARLGFNPLDAGNRPPTGVALASLQVTPTSVSLSINTLLGQAPITLRVTGTLTDGSTVDLTSAPGTTYQSLDEAVAVVDDSGNVAGVAPGTAAVKVQNTTFSAQATVNVSSFTPGGLASIRIPGYANNVEVAGNYAYVAAGSTGLQIVDVADRGAPVVVASLNTPGNSVDVRVIDNLAYVADGSSGLQIINITNPTAPVLVGTLNTPGNAQDVVVYGNRAYIADGISGLQIVDVSNPQSPTLMTSFNGASGTTAKGVDVSGDIAVIAEQSSGSSLRLVNVSNPSAPVEAGLVQISGEAKDVFVRDRLAYVAAYTGGIQIVDFTDPSAASVVGTLQQGMTGGFVPRDVVVAGDFLFAAEQLFPNAVPVVHVGTPSQPRYRGIIDFSPLADYAGTGIALDQSFVYMTGESFIVSEDIGTDGDTALFIGQLHPQEDTASVAPTISITAPQNGQIVTSGVPLRLAVTARDDVGVARVDFIVNGNTVGSDSNRPFEFAYTLPDGISSVVIGAEAYDYAGNVGRAAQVVVGIGSDVPSVEIVNPPDGAQVFEGQTLKLNANATDNVRVTRVVFTVNGTALPAITDAPYVQSYKVPNGVTSLVIEAAATDNVNHTGRDTNTVSVVPDPGTTVVGRVVDGSGQPVANAAVKVFEASAQSGADGSFSIQGVLSVQGDVAASAIGIVGGRQVFGSSVRVTPLMGGVTDVGSILLRESNFETEIGTLAPFTDVDSRGIADDAAVAVTLPFAFNFYGVTYTQVYLGTNGYLTFGTPDDEYEETVPGFANGAPRIAALYNDWYPYQKPGNGVYVNTSLQGRVAFTWQRVPHYNNGDVGAGESTINEKGTFQIILFADGRIQFGYDGVIPRGGLVGISPGGNASAQKFDFTKAVSFSTDEETAPYEQFFGATDQPFDLDNFFITHTPKVAGGYDIQVLSPLPTTFQGRVLDPQGNPVNGATVVAGKRSTQTSADGTFTLTKVYGSGSALLVKVVRVAPDGRFLQAVSSPTLPVPNGLTNLGDLTLIAKGQAFETDTGVVVEAVNGEFPTREFNLPFPFPYYYTTYDPVWSSYYSENYSRVFVNARGYLGLTSQCVAGCGSREDFNGDADNFIFSNTPLIAPFYSKLNPAQSGQVFVKALPDRWIMTFRNVEQAAGEAGEEASRGGGNTFQVVLYPDGQIRFTYDGIATSFAHVGIATGQYSGKSEIDRPVNLNAPSVLHVDHPQGVPIWETFLGNLGGQQSAHPFDLDRTTIIFMPNGNGGFDVVREKLPLQSPPPPQLLFDSDRDGDNDIYVMRADGSDQVNLTNSVGDDYGPVWSPDRSRIAFDTYRDDPRGYEEEVYVMNADGSGQINLTHSPGDDYKAKWSPDGTRLAFFSNRDGNYEVYVMNADGSNQTNLTNSPSDEGDFVWSPDGSKILFINSETGNADIYVMNADGSGKTNLTNTAGDEYGATWSPDGSKIAFESRQSAQIHLINPDGSGLVNLSNNATANYRPTWSPDGSKIAFESYQDGNFEIYVMKADGSDQTRLTNYPGTDYVPHWSPDGAQISFVRGVEENNTFNYEVFVINADGSNPVNLTNHRASEFGYGWEPIPQLNFPM